MIDDPPPLPDREPPPLPAPPARPKNRKGLGLFLLFTAVLAALYIGPLRVELRFIDDNGRVPGGFEAIVRSASSEKKILVQNGRLNLLRGRWNELEVTDLSYVRSTHPVREGTIRIERNTLLKLRQAAVGQPSVPQRGDPDPRAE